MRDATRDTSDPVEGHWLNLAEAGAAMGRSTKTLERWVRSGRIETRKVGDRREVWVTAPVSDTRDTPPETSDTRDMSDIEDNDAPDPARMSLISTEQAMLPSLALANRVADEMERQTARAEVEIRRSRRWAVGAWTAVVVLVVAGGIAIWAITDRAGQLRQAQEQAADAARMATDRLRDMSGRLTKSESRAVAAATEARQAQERAAGLELQLTEAQAAVEISMAKQHAAERERDAVRQLLNTRQVAAVVTDGDVPGGGVEGGQ